MIISYPCDWGCYGVLGIFLIYLVPKEKRYFLGILIFYLTVSIINGSIEILEFNIKFGYDISISIIISSIIDKIKDNVYMLFAILVLKFYNGNRGKYNLKYLFYCFYPLHLIILDIFIFIK